MQPPRVLIVSALRNEGPYVIDWLAHLIGAGAGEFLLYTNDCDDGTDTLLDLLAGAGVVTHRRHTPAPDTSIQWQAFRDAWKSDQRKAADWALVCDVDEYINIKLPGHGFADLIGALPEDTDAVALPWRLFGDSGHTRAKDTPVTERFTRAMTEACVFPVHATYFKTLMRTGGPFNQFGIHRPSQKDRTKAPLPVWVDGTGRPLPDDLAATPARLSLMGLNPGRDLAELNHYSLRSAEEFIVKAHRGLPNTRTRAIDLRYWVERNFNTASQTSIAAMAPQTRAAKERLLAIPGVAEAHAHAVAWHRDAFARLLGDPAYLDLLSHIALAGDSRELPDNTAQQLYALHPKAR